MFIPYTWHHESEPWELQPAAAGLELEPGVALAYEDGELVKATGTTKPEFICMEQTETVEGQYVHVERVRHETEYMTELSVESADIAVGGKYTIDANGEKITATTSGAAEVVWFEGTAAGSKVRVRF